MSTLSDPPTPPGRKRFGWYSVAWAGWGVAFFLIEGLAIRKNNHGGREDYQHRTLTENVRFLAATDRDGQQARWRRFRRIGLWSLLAWLVPHFVTNGEYV